MRHIKIPVSFFRRLDVMKAAPRARGTWISLFAHCEETENKGTIPNARSMQDADWQMLAGVSLKDIESAELAGFVRWVNDDLFVTGLIPEDQPGERRERARKAAKARWEKAQHAVDTSFAGPGDIAPPVTIIKAVPIMPAPRQTNALDQLRVAGAFMRPDEFSAWELLVEKYGLSEVLKAVNDGKKIRKTFFSSIRDALDNKKPDFVERSF